MNSGAQPHQKPGRYDRPATISELTSRLAEMEVEIANLRHAPYMWWVRNNKDKRIIEITVGVTHEFLHEVDAIGNGPTPQDADQEDHMYEMIASSIPAEVRRVWKNAKKQSP